jgi:hypothetical protein
MNFQFNYRGKVLQSTEFWLIDSIVEGHFMTGQQEKNRWITIAWRWIDLVVLCVFACAIYLISEPFLRRRTERIIGVVTKWNWGVVWIFLIVISTGFWMLLQSFSGSSFKNLFRKIILRNPPVWICGLGASFLFWCLLYFGLLGSTREVKFDLIDLGRVISLFCGAGAAAWGIEYILNKQKRSLLKVKSSGSGISKTASVGDIAGDIKSLVEWIHKDEAIKSPAEDRFGMDVFARRITEMLGQTPLKTITVVGPYGCGKSSVLKMIEYYCKHPDQLNEGNKEKQSVCAYPLNNVIMCTVNGWGLEEGTSAEQILQTVIEELCRHTECTSIVGLPREYRKALAGSGGMLGKIADTLLYGWDKPRDVLNKLDALLARIDRRMVIFLEDIDRDRRPEIFFNEIAALLDGLKELENVTFVLAIGEERKEDSVLLRIAEHIEAIPRLDRRSAIKACKTLREYCLSKLDPTLKVISDEERDRRMGIWRSDPVGSVAEVHEQMQKPIDWITMLLNEPRLLKAALRRTYQIWEKLFAEVEFDDVLIVNTLRVAAPEAFMFVHENVAKFQYFGSGHQNPEQKDKTVRDKSREGFKKIGKRTTWNPEIVCKLINVLFPTFLEEIKWMSHPYHDYQKVLNAEPTDYWARLMREELLAEEIGDKEILLAINKWNANRKDKAFREKDMREALLSSDEVFNKMRQFKEFIGGETLRSLAQEQFRITLEKEKNRASGENCPAAGQWWLLKSKTIDQTWIEWIGNEICKAIPISLDYANSLYHFWLEPKLNDSEPVRSRVIEEARRVYVSNPKNLIAALNPLRFSVRHFAIQYSEPGYGGKGFNPQEWQWLGDALFAGIRIDRELIIPQIVFLVGTMDRKPGRKSELVYTYILNIDLAKGIFVGHFEELMRLLAEEIDVSRYEEEVRVYVKLCQGYARKWLVDQGDGVR